MANYFQDNEDLQYYVNQELPSLKHVKLVEPVMPTPTDRKASMKPKRATST